MLMLSIFHRIKILTLSLILISTVLFVLDSYYSLWQPHQAFIEKVTYGLLGITIIFATYFNQSRLTLLSTLWLALILTLDYSLPWSEWLTEHSEWLFIFSLYSLLLLGAIKDRSVFSIHGIYRIAFIILTGIFAWAWLVGYQFLTTYLIQNSQKELLAWVTYCQFGVPAGSTLAFLGYRYIKTNSLFVSALFVTSAFLCVHYFQWLVLPLSVSISLLCSYYLCVLVIESYFLAYRDELTSLPSRRALFQHVLSLGRKYHVAMLDIDHFKKFNDTYGHDIGDQVLKLVAGKIGEVTNGGKAFRYGGEEFTVVFSRKNQSSVIDALEAVRESIEGYSIVIRQPQREDKSARGKSNRNDMKTVNVTISIGVASRVSKQTFEQTLKVADQALYRAKKQGRNNVSK